MKKISSLITFVLWIVFLFASCGKERESLNPNSYVNIGEKTYSLDVGSWNYYNASTNHILAIFGSLLLRDKNADISIDLNWLSCQTSGGLATGTYLAGNIYPAYSLANPNYSYVSHPEYNLKENERGTAISLASLKITVTQL